jgi:hypothetical protein
LHFSLSVQDKHLQREVLNSNKQECGYLVCVIRKNREKYGIETPSGSLKNCHSRHILLELGIRNTGPAFVDDFSSLCSSFRKIRLPTPIVPDGSGAVAAAVVQCSVGAARSLSKPQYAVEFGCRVLLPPLISHRCRLEGAKYV